MKKPTAIVKKPSEGVIKIKKPVQKAKKETAVDKSKVKKITKKAEAVGISHKLQEPINGTEKKMPAAKQKPVNGVASPKKKSLHKKKYVHRGGVVKINSLPHGFYEDQLKGYFTQFGDVTNVKVSRSQKTGRSKGVAYVEFSIPEVAEIAAETMNNYLMFKNVLKTTYIPPAKVNRRLFWNAVTVKELEDGRKVVQSRLTHNQAKEVEHLNAPVTDEVLQKRNKRIEEKLANRAKYLKKLGVEFDIDSVITGERTPKVTVAEKKVKAAPATNGETVAKPAADIKVGKQKKAKTAPKVAVAKPKKTAVAKEQKVAVANKQKPAKGAEKQTPPPKKANNGNAQVKVNKSKPKPPQKVETGKVITKKIAKVAVPVATVANVKKSPTNKKVPAVKTNSPAQKKIVQKKTEPKKKPVVAKAAETSHKQKNNIVAKKKNIQNKKPLKLTPTKSVKK